MAPRFWVGGSGTWDNSSTTHWANVSNGAGGQTVPGSGDDVTFDVNSGAGATVTVNHATLSVRSIVINGWAGSAILDFATNNNNISIGTAGFTDATVAAHTINMGNGTWTLATAAASAGNLWVATNTSLTLNRNSSTLVFSANTTATGNGIRWGGKTYGAVQFTSPAGSKWDWANSAGTFASMSISAGNFIALGALTYVFESAPTWIGTATAPIILSVNTITATPATFSCAAGTFSLTYGILDDVIGSGGATFQGTNTVGYRTNTGWTITPPTGGGPTDILKFTDLTFNATGASALRTMPNRLAEIKNARDYGAIPGSDATSAIQAAVNAAIAEGGGTVFIPPGNYTISSPGIAFNNDADFGLTITGSGYATFLTANFSGYVIDRHLATPNNTKGPRVIEHLRIANTNASGGCIRLGSTIGGAVRDCHMTSNFNGFTSEDAAGVSSKSITVQNCIFSGSATTTALVLGGSGIINANDITNLGTGMRLYGQGISVLGGRMERCDTAIMLGVDLAGTNRGLNGFELSGMPMEGNTTAIDFLGTVSGFSIGPLSHAGHDFHNAGAPISGSDGAAGTQYTIRIRADKAYAGEFISITPTSQIEVAGIYIEDYTTRSFVTFVACNPDVGGGGGVGWRISTATAGFKFIECDIDASANAPNGTRYAFSGLPGSGTRLEGDEYDIFDANTTTLGANITAGGGSGRVRARWNGTNWVCIGV